jgi:hypothetical protein
MTRQTDLFPDDPTPQRAHTPLPVIVPEAAGRMLSAAQQRFNLLLARVVKLRQQIEAVQTLADTQRPLHQRVLQPLRERHLALMRQMAVWLDERLHKPGLSVAHKKIASEILCSLSESLAANGDEDMRALHDRHSALSLEQKQQQAAQEMRAMMEEALGRPLATEQSLDTLDDVLIAGLGQMREAAEAEHAAHQQARAQRKPSATQRRADAQQHDAEATLRTLYRRLSSALHPDREQDSAQHAIKSALMVEANTAYQRRDLLALLHIQLQIEQTDAQSLARIADEKIASMNVLLKQQIEQLEHERDTLKQQALQEFGMSPHHTFTVASLRKHLALEKYTLNEDLAMMEYDLRIVRDDASFKRWLKQQKRHSALDDRDVF